MEIGKIIAFGIFWLAVGMLLMLFFRFRIFGVIVALLLLVASFYVLTRDGGC